MGAIFLRQASKENSETRCALYKIRILLNILKICVKKLKLKNIYYKNRKLKKL